MPDSAQRPRKRSAASGAIGLAFHWLAFLVKIWQAVISQASARSISRSCPPATDICAPSSSTPGLLVVPSSPGGNDHTPRRETASRQDGNSASTARVDEMPRRDRHDRERPPPLIDS